MFVLYGGKDDPPIDTQLRLQAAFTKSEAPAGLEGVWTSQHTGLMTQSMHVAWCMAVRSAKETGDRLACLADHRGALYALSGAQAARNLELACEAFPDNDLPVALMAAPATVPMLADAVYAMSRRGMLFGVFTGELSEANARAWLQLMVAVRHRSPR